jgi:hypothetical protein
VNYGQLKTAIASWANRSDLTALLPTFLELAEQRIYMGDDENGVNQLRVSSMLTTVNPFGGTVPTDLLQLHRIAVTLGTGIKRTLQFRSLEQIAAQSVVPGEPAFYSIQNQTVVYGPTFDYPVELIYYAKFVTPSADADTNWLLTNAAGVYLYATLIEVAQWSKDMDMLQTAARLWKSAQQAVIANDIQGQSSGSTLTVRTDISVR